MSNTTGNSPLAGVLGELGWRPEALARRLNGLATVQGRTERVHAKTPYKWLKGDQPRSPWPALAAALLTDELGRPIIPADLGWEHDEAELVSAISGLVLPWTVAGSLRAMQVVTDAGGMERRIFLTLLGTAACAPAHEWLIAHPEAKAALAHSAPGSALPETAVDYLDTIAAQLRRMDDQFGGGALLPIIRMHLQRVRDLISGSRYTDTVGRRLHATAAELMRQAGWAAFEGGYHPLAQRYWVAGLHAAHAAGDRALGAHIVGFMSEQAVDLGQIREATNLAETARAGYPGATPRVVAILDLHAAHAYALDGAATQCQRALDNAFDRLGDAPSSCGEPDWSYWIDEAVAHAQAGYSYLRLGDGGWARQHLSAALRSQDPRFAREGARRNIELATTYLRQNQPEVDHAVGLASRAVETLTSPVDSARIVGYLTRFIDHLAPYRKRPAVRQLLDQAADLRAA